MLNVCAHSPVLVQNPNVWSPLKWPYCFHFSHLFTFHARAEGVTAPHVNPKLPKSLQLKSKQTRKPICNESPNSCKSLRECLILRNPICCFLLLKGPLFLIWFLEGRQAELHTVLRTEVLARAHLGSFQNLLLFRKTTYLCSVSVSVDCLPALWRLLFP